MLINQEVKGQLAKLLATENLTIEHRKVSTAYFDVEKRILCLPIWKSASNTVYDLLVGHEVGHALYTPAEELNDAPKAFVNVLEDARIERMMKVKYPGLRNTFFKGYQELWNDGFFGVSDGDIEQLSLIDRMNLFFKGNASIEFDPSEQVYVDRAANTVTFKDVLELAREMYDRAEQKDQESEEITPPEIPFNGEKDLDGEYELGEKQSVPAGQGEGEDGEGGKGRPDLGEDDTLFDDEFEDEGLDYDVHTTGHYGGGTKLESDFSEQQPETTCVTEEALAESIETLVDEDAREWVYLSMPKIKDINKVIIGHKKIQEDLENHFEEEYNKNVDPTQDDWVQRQVKEQRDAIEGGYKHYQSFKKSTTKTVNYLLKQFEMKKSADQYKRQATSKTGVINTQSLYKYKLTEDIFKKITVIPDGKNHGLVMFLDWSGSMSQCLLDTLKQTYNLVWFCKKANIPFRVYGFQSGFCNSYSYGNDLNVGFEFKENQLAVGNDFRLLEFLTSRQNNQSLEKSMKALYLQVYAMNNWNVKASNEYGLGGTPLAEAIYCAKTIVAQMKAQEKVQKVNVVCLTDGEANPMNYTTRCIDHSVLRSRNICSNSHVFVLRDKATGYQKRLNGSPYQTTKEIVSYMRQITDYNWIGIRLCSKSEVNRVARNYTENYEDLQRYDKQWRKEKFISIKDDAGFTEAFFMPDRNHASDSDNLEIKQKGVEATRAELNRAFKKHMSSKMQNKTILNKFIEQIA